MGKLKDWLQAKDVSNDLGGGCLMSAIRIVIVVFAVLFTVLILIFNMQ